MTRASLILESFIHGKTAQEIQGELASQGREVPTIKAIFQAFRTALKRPCGRVRGRK